MQISAPESDNPHSRTQIWDAIRKRLRLRHTAITTAIEKGQRAGIGLDQIRAFSGYRSLSTMLIYRDEHD
jgi:hypothetical protein